jgi:ABC-type multidrug transport system permease subunit
MLFYFHFSDMLELPVNLSIAIIISLIILTSPIWISYSVFRNPSKRRMEYQIVRKFSKWLSLICAASLIITLCVIKWAFINESCGNQFLFILIISAALTFIFGIISLPRWQGFLAIFCYVWYCIYFITL